MRLNASTITRAFCWSMAIGLVFWSVAFAQLDDRGSVRPWVLFFAGLSSWVSSMSLLWLVIYSAAKAARVPDQPSAPYKG